MSIDPDARTAKLQGGEEVAFGKALIGTGAMVNILRVEGAENEGIHYLRAFGNSDAIRADAEAAEHVVLIGGSYIGTEVAASLTAKGVRCTIVMMEDIVLSRTFGEDAGRWFQETIEGHGVTIHGGEELEAFEGDGRVRAVVTKSGRAIECDTVVVGAGVRPDAMLAQRAGLDVDNGIICDSKLETSARGRLRGGGLLLLRERRPRPAAAGRALGRRDAAGDARGEATCSARIATTTSSPTSSATSPTGPASSTSAPPTSGTRRSGAVTAMSGQFSVWYLKDGRVAGALSVERPEDLAEARRMLADGVDVSALGRRDRRPRLRPRGDRRLSGIGLAPGILPVPPCGLV